MCVVSPQTSTRVRLTHVPATPPASRWVTADIFVSALRASPGKTVWLKLGPASQMGNELLDFILGQIRWD